MRKHRWTRRDFMRAGASAAIASRTIVLEPNFAPASGRAVPPSDRVRFGIIGVGMQGSGLLRTAISLPGVECVAACELYDGRQELAREITGKPIAATRRYQDLLDNQEIDCIINATPDHWHRKIVVDCCDAGKDVYCEKPMTHAVGEGFEMIDAERRNKRIVQVGSQRPSSVVYGKAREIVEKGLLGEVFLAEGLMGRNDPEGAWQYPLPPELSPQNLDWDTWLGTAPKIPFNPVHYQRWRCWQAYGSGVAGDLIVHLLTGIHFITGVNAPPERAMSSGGLYRWKDGRDVPDVHAVVFDYPRLQVYARVTQNTETPEVTRIMGTRGLLEIRDGALTFTPQDGLNHGPSFMSGTWPKAQREGYLAKFRGDHPYQHDAQVQEVTRYTAPPGYSDTREHLYNFFSAVRTRKPVLEDATFGNHTAIACHMANHAYFKRAMATWDASNRSIRG